jgi:predicted acyltransferase
MRTGWTGWKFSWRPERIMAESINSPLASEGRLISLDFFRGLTMFLLIGEATHFYSLLVSPSLEGSIIHAIGLQFHHHPWNGLRFWDLIQPFFMFIVGVAMPFSFGRRRERGESRRATLGHAVRRSLILLALGVSLYCVAAGRLTFELWNVLAQLSFTYLVAYLMMRRATRTQLLFTFALLFISEMLYRFWPVPGFNQPFVPDHNFGSWIDLQLMGKLSLGHWVAFNAVPTTAHTMWGVLAGQLLRSGRPAGQKIRTLMAAGLGGIVLGYALNPLTPIIKRICTSSFVIASGGYCLLALALSYWLIDVLNRKRGARFFVVVGMNPIFIYLFTETGGAKWLNGIAKPFTLGFFGWLGELPSQMLTSIAVWGMLWSICYWLYRKKILIKI